MSWLAFGYCVIMSMALAGLAAICALGIRVLLRRSTAFFLVFTAASSLTSITAQKTNNVPPNMNAPQMQQGSGSFQTGFTGLTGLSGALPHMPSSLNPVNLVNPVQNNIPVQTTNADISRGWRVECVATNATVSYAMPTNAATVGNWHVHGAASSFGKNLVDFGVIRTSGTLVPTNWSFPLGTNDAAFSSFWYFVDGRIRPTPKDAAHEICAVGVPMSAVPGQSRMWRLDGDGNCVITWESFFLGGDTNAPVNAQIELFDSGDFTVRSNGVETVCRRVNPDDWDDDGIENAIDPNPLFCDGDFFGPANILPEGANSNAYCTVSLVVDGRDALVVFEGDGPSNYPDPRFVARRGVTNEVFILIGKTYTVSSAASVRCVGVSDPCTEIVVHDPRSFAVVRPVEVSFSEEGTVPMRMRAGLRSGMPGGRSFMASVLPSCLGGNLVLASCCPIETTGLAISYLHDPYCSCRGCQPTGRYEYEGFWIAVFPPSCCCLSEGVEGDGGGDGEPDDDNEPSAANPLFSSFSLPFALYEESYLNEVGGTRFSARAQPVTLNVGVYGGSYGGSWTLTIANEGKLGQVGGTSARSGFVSAGEALELEIEYKASAPSDSANDIVATVAFTENFTGSNSVDTATLTAVKLELEADVCVSDSTRNRHHFGVAEDVYCRATPSAVPGFSFYASQGTYNDVTGIWTCPVTNSLAFGGLFVCSDENPVYMFFVTTTPPTGVVAEHAVGLDFGVPSGTAGGSGMILDLYVLPKSVSFLKLSLAEVPTTTVGPTGYFTNMEFSAVWYHTPAMGSGDWHGMRRSDTHWFDDQAMMGDAFPSRNILEWDDGTIIWDIPVAWELAEVVNKTYDKRIPVVYEQRFDFSANGTLRVTKHDFWEERDADNTQRGSKGINVWVNPPSWP